MALVVLPKKLIDSVMSSSVKIKNSEEDATHRKEVMLDIIALSFNDNNICELYELLFTLIYPQSTPFHVYEIIWS
jgi:hypothetical protein